MTGSNPGSCSATSWSSTSSLKRPDRDGVHVEVVAGRAPAVEGADLVGDRVLEGEDRSDLEPDGLVSSPVDAEVDLELVAVAGGDHQAGELGSTPGHDGLVAMIGEGADGPLHRGRESVDAGVVGEQVDVLGRSVDHTVLADGAGSGQREVVATDHGQDERRRGTLLLQRG